MKPIGMNLIIVHSYLTRLLIFKYFAVGSWFSSKLSKDYFIEKRITKCACDGTNSYSNSSCSEWYHTEPETYCTKNYSYGIWSVRISFSDFDQKMWCFRSNLYIEVKKRVKSISFEKGDLFTLEAYILGFFGCTTWYWTTFEWWC